MKKLIFVFGVVLPALSFAWQASFRIDSSSTTIPSSFDASNAASLVASSLVNAWQVCACNESTTRLNLNTKDATATPSTVTHRIPASSCACFGNIARKMGTRVYIAGDGGTITSGLVYGHVD